MSRRATSTLRIVRSDEPQESTGDATLTEQRMGEWSEGQRLCRTRGRHHWKRFHAFVHGKDPNQVGTRFDVIERCPDCLNRRSADHVRTVRGIRRIEDWRPDYREVNGVPYLLPKGAQRITDDVREELIGTDILSHKLTFVDDD